MRGLTTVFLGSGLVAAIVTGAALLGFFATRGPSGAETGLSPRVEAEITASTDENGSDIIDDTRLVDVIHPRLDPSFVISVSEIADVKPYYRAELCAQVAGVVKYIQKNRGDRVVKGEPLIVIDVPDLVFAEKEKEAMVVKSRKERDLAKEKIAIAEAAVEIADAAIKQRQAEVKKAVATRDYRRLMWDRLVKFAKTEATSQSLADEEKRNYEAAVGDYENALATVEKAQAQKKDADANLKAAKAELEFRESLIKVAEEDRNKAQALEGYATIRAPYDGVVVDRTVDPGDFVQNAATAHTEPLLTIDRDDIVTVVMYVPDNFAPYISRNIDAVIQMGDMVISGKVTRYAPAIVKTEGRTIRVEVDIFNGTRRADYDKFVQSVKDTWAKERKGSNDPLPLFPRISGPGVRDQAHPLIAGMVGKMRLFLRRFENVYLVPSDVVFQRAGYSYIAEVKDGKVHLQLVEEQAKDGKLAKIALVSREEVGQAGEREVLTDLTGKETIIRSGQAELSEGQQVRMNLKNW
jgi:multidrug efflux pump subunit AcrA (membrane-fusion protein)